jgi:hypothetical protein
MQEHRNVIIGATVRIGAGRTGRGAMRAAIAVKLLASKIGDGLLGPIARVGTPGP